jgi:hypothetical protein
VDATRVEVVDAAEVDDDAAAGSGVGLLDRGTETGRGIEIDFAERDDCDLIALCV